MQHKFVQHGGREQRLFVAKGLPDKDQSHHGLAAGVQPQGVQSVQRLLAGLVQRQVQQKAAVVLPAALVGKEVGVAAGVQTVKALVQRKAGAELGQAGGAVLAAAVCLPPGEQVHDDAQRTGQKTDGNDSVHGKTSPKRVFLIVTQPAGVCAIIFTILF